MLGKETVLPSAFTILNVMMMIYTTEIVHDYSDSSTKWQISKLVHKPREKAVISDEARVTVLVVVVQCSPCAHVVILMWP